ncbi:MAG: T9SS type A sorting domain-containing protein [Salibacteraceae bacterium]|nr:T9SS type A sorting domain-containing protein [Salibacteraceae bacterium]|tara:strand:+ start:43082 stop:43954 length:873 start_codon:yes stop_codon:yes gene_type:complete
MFIRLFIVVSILLSSLLSSSQFAPVGSVWHYNIGDGHPFRHFTRLESVKDTLFLGFNAKKICALPCSSDDKPTYVAQAQDTIFIYRTDKNEFVKLFYYGGKVGDTLYLDIPDKDLGNNSSHYKSVITKVFNTIVNGIAHKTYLHNSESLMRGGKFIEGIGFTSQFLPDWWIRTANQHTGLRCFNGNLVEEQFKDIACDSYGVSIPEMSNNTTQVLMAFPNPANNDITIDAINLESVSQLKMINANGITVLENKQPFFPLVINTTDLPSGIYFLMVSTKNNESLVQKIVLK